MFVFREQRGRVEVAFTDRHGPEGTPLNLALPGSAPAAVPGTDVTAAYEQVSDHLDGVPLAGMRQVHGSRVAVLDPDLVAGGVAEPPEADGLVTDAPGVALLVRVADCVPVLLADPERGVVGAAHAGRLGVLAQVVPHAVRVMREHGARAIEAWIGPHVCGGCYEVPEAMRAEVAAAVPATGATTRWGTPSLDLGAGVRAQLAELDVAVTETGRCTMEDDDLWSHRRQGQAAGRLGGLVRVLDREGRP